MEGSAGISTPPYPLTPEEWQTLQHREESEWRQQQQQQQQQQPPPGFDLKDLDSALAGAARPTTDKKDQELPDALKVFAPRNSEVKRSSSELRRDYAKGAIPNALRPGAGRALAETPGPAAVAASTSSSAEPPPPPDSDHCKPACSLTLPIKY